METDFKDKVGKVLINTLRETVEERWFATEPVVVVRN